VADRGLFFLLLRLSVGGAPSQTTLQPSYASPRCASWPRKHWIGLVGIVPLLTAFFGFCLAYAVFGISPRRRLRT